MSNFTIDNSTNSTMGVDSNQMMEMGYMLMGTAAAVVVGGLKCLHNKFIATPEVKAVSEQALAAIKLQSLARGVKVRQEATATLKASVLPRATTKALNENTIHGQISAKFTAKVATFVYALLSILSFGIVNLVNHIQTKSQKAKVRKEVEDMNYSEVKELDAQFKKETAGAVKMQSLFRGFGGRQIAKAEKQKAEHQRAEKHLQAQINRENLTSFVKNLAMFG